MTNYSGKINQSTQFQLGSNKEYIFTFIRFVWDERPLPDSECKIVRNRTYRNVSQSSYNRIADLCQRLADSGVGRLNIWSTWVGWEYKDRGEAI